MNVLVSSSKISSKMQDYIGISSAEGFKRTYLAFHLSSVLCMFYLYGETTLTNNF